MTWINLTFFAIFSKCLADFKPLSLGHKFRGFTKSKFSNPKQPIDLVVLVVTVVLTIVVSKQLKTKVVVAVVVSKQLKTKVVVTVIMSKQLKIEVLVSVVVSKQLKIKVVVAVVV